MSSVRPTPGLRITAPFATLSALPGVRSRPLRTSDVPLFRGQSSSFLTSCSVGFPRFKTSPLALLLHR